MGFIADTRQWVLNELTKEPEGGKASWVILGIGVLFLLSGIAGFVIDGVDVEMKYILVGIAFLCSGAAESVPPSRLQTAKTLRILAWIGAMLFFGWIVIPPFLAASGETKLMVVGVIPVAFAYVFLLYKVLNN
jgi:uncharacterized membrane protein HdeD (DUF308 family)